MELTVREAGAEGVHAAIRDGMKAAEYARELEAVKAEYDKLHDENRKLRHDIRAKDEEIGRLRKQCREYRFSRSQAYRATLDAQAHGSDSRLNRFLARLLLVLSGSVLTFAVVTAIIWGSRI